MWSNDIKCISMLLFPLKKLACKELNVLSVALTRWLMAGDGVWSVAIRLTHTPSMQACATFHLWFFSQNYDLSTSNICTCHHSCHGMCKIKRETMANNRITVKTKFDLQWKIAALYVFLLNSMTHVLTKQQHLQYSAIWMNACMTR